MPISLTLRQTKGSELTFQEMDDNLIALRDQAEENDHKVVTVTTTHNITNANKIILADATTAGYNVVLPDPSTSTNEIYTIKKIDATANVVTVTPNNTETIEGLSSQPLNNQYDFLRVVSDGLNWFIV